MPNFEDRDGSFYDAIDHQIKNALKEEGSSEMRSGYVRELESGNWYVVEYVKTKHVVLLDSAEPTGPPEALRIALKLDQDDLLTLGAEQEKHGLPYYKWSLG